MGTDQQVAGREVVANVAAEDLALNFVGQEHGDDIGPLGRFGGRDGLETILDGLLVIGRAGQFGHDHIAAAIAEVLGVTVPLRAVAQDGDRLVLQQRDVGVFVVVDFGGHGYVLGRGARVSGLGIRVTIAGPSPEPAF